MPPIAVSVESAEPVAESDSVPGSERRPVPRSPAPAALLAAAIALSIGALLLTRLSATAVLATAPLWLLLAFAATRRERPAAALQQVATLASAQALTLLGVWLFELPQHVPMGADFPRHQPFGEHPVFAWLGFPWPGIAASGHALAHDAIPLRHGVDALLANFACWLAAVALLRWRCSAAVEFVWLACCAAAFAALGGGYRLLSAFD